MGTEKSRYLKSWFWGIIAVGASLPLVGMVVADFLWGSKSLLEAIKPWLSAFVSPIALVVTLLMLLWNNVPFIVFAWLIKSQLGKSEEIQIYFYRMARMIGGGIAAFTTSLFIQLIVLRAGLRSVPGYSTTSLIYGILPFYVLIAMGVGYWGGGLIGRLIIWRRSQKKVN